MSTKKKLSDEAINKLIKKYQKKSYSEIADEISKVGVNKSGKKVTEKNVTDRYVRMKLPSKKAPSIPSQVEKDVNKMIEKREQKTSDKKYNFLLDRVSKLEAEHNATLEVKNNPIQPFEIATKVSTGNSEAIAVVLASDWHIEEIVDPRNINDLNKFNLDIAKERAEQFFRTTLQLTEIEQHSRKIDTLVLALLGDFISGNIHEELLENTGARPIDAIIKAQTMLASGIKFLLDKSKLKLLIPCHVGNHTRITKKVHISTEAGNSLETAMYHFLKEYFRNEPRVEFRIAQGYHSFLTLPGYHSKSGKNFTIRFHHGHAVQFGGGIGGLTIPVRKAISQWQKGNYADLDCFGHFHQTIDGGDFIVNGSLIGYNAFALRIKAEFEPPKQVFFTIDKKRGKDCVRYIHVQRDKSEKKAE